MSKQLGKVCTRSIIGADFLIDWISNYKTQYAQEHGPLPMYPDTDPVASTVTPIAQCDFAFLEVENGYSSQVGKT